MKKYFLEFFGKNFPGILFQRTENQSFLTLPKTKMANVYTHYSDVDTSVITDFENNPGVKKGSGTIKFGRRLQLEFNSGKFTTPYGVNSKDFNGNPCTGRVRSLAINVNDDEVLMSKMTEIDDAVQSYISSTPVFKKNFKYYPAVRNGCIQARIILGGQYATRIWVVNPEDESEGTYYPGTIKDIVRDAEVEFKGRITGSSYAFEKCTTKLVLDEIVVYPPEGVVDVSTDAPTIKLSRYETLKKSSNFDEAMKAATAENVFFDPEAKEVSHEDAVAEDSGKKKKANKKSKKRKLSTAPSTPDPIMDPEFPTQEPLEV